MRNSEFRKTLTDYAEPYPGARKKLTDALTVMTLGFVAAEIKKDADAFFERLRMG